MTTLPVLPLELVRHIIGFARPVYPYLIELHMEIAKWEEREYIILWTRTSWHQDYQEIPNLMTFPTYFDLRTRNP